MSYYTTKDLSIIRDLAQRYREISTLDRQVELMDHYKDSNALKGVRPLVLVDEIPWRELDYDGSLTLACQDSELRELEFWLRTMLFRWKHLKDDTIFPDYYEIKYHLHTTGIGVDISEDTLDTDSGSGVQAHSYHDQLSNDEDLARFRPPIISLDSEGTNQQRERLNEALNGILPVKVTGHRVYCPTWDNIVRYHGAEAVLYDLALRPDFLHRIMRRFTEIYTALYDQYEALNVLELEPLTIHCTPALSYDLPGEGFDGVHVRKKDVWGRSMAQIFSTVSPKMHDEFDISYAMELFKDYGLFYYGCCEPLHKKIDILRPLKNLRKISISPWAEPVAAAEALGKDYVYSYKLNPASVAVRNFDKDQVNRELDPVIRACRKNGCQLELIIKDLSTVCGNYKTLVEMVNTVTATAMDF